ncbi:MAG: hypothetical protein ABIY52_00200 [Gemmatimonadaceae bacterium]
MNCREFRRKHGGYIDDTLSGVELERMASHRRVCGTCAQLDTRVRRALLVARNLPTIDVSAAFSQRLQARLDVERASLTLMRNGTPAETTWRWGQFSASAYAVVAAGVFAAAGLAGAVVLYGGEEDVIRLAPVVASLPEPEPSTFMTPTMVAAVPAGMPLWSAVFVAQQAPYHFASDEASR